uniref:Reverse transcriptase domain-containing protein n=1 Tax=Gadus morhua TaxID=8049 RepID=A0A8C5AGY4_GADMO
MISGKQKAPWRKAASVTAQKKQCRKVERIWRKTKLHIHHDIYKESLRAYNLDLKNARETFFSNIIKTNTNNAKTLFATVDRQTNPPTEIPPDLHSTQKCNEFAAFYIDKIEGIRRAINISTSNKNVGLPPCSGKNYVARMACFNVIDSQNLVETDTTKAIHLLPIIKNYRPISNLPFISKIIEKVVLQQLNHFMASTVCYDTFQSGFRPLHSTETALIKVVNDIRLNTDSGKTSILMLLDLSAAFDTVDHTLLLERLENWVGLSGTVLNWFRSYLQNRNYFVSIGDFVSESTNVTCGVPQGSILGPSLFNIDMLPLGQIMQNNNIDHHCYADDTQIYVSLSPNDYRPIDLLCQCIEQVKEWMCRNFLQLNEEKTEIIVFGSKTERLKVTQHLHSLSLKTSIKARNLGVIMDSDLHFDSHIKSVTKSAYYHLKNVARLRGLMSTEDLQKLVHAFITSKLDYCNGLLTGLPKQTLRKLQLVQNAAARVLTKTKKFDHITPILKSLHWLPVGQRIDFKIMLLTYKSLHGLGPKYLTDMLPLHQPSRPLRSSETNLLIIPRVNTKHGKAGFSYYATNSWNKLPEDLRLAPTLSTFKTKLKTFMFAIAFC